MTPIVLTLIDLIGATVAIAVAYTIGVNRGHRTCPVCATRHRRAAALRQASHRTRGAVSPDPIPGDGPPPGLYDVVWSEQNEHRDPAHQIYTVEIPARTPDPEQTWRQANPALRDATPAPRLTVLRRVQ